MTINVGHLYKKRTVRNLKGDIIDMVDEADGGWIIRKGQVVNQEKFQEFLRKEHDKKEAAKAIAEGIANMPAPQAQPGKVESLEKRVNEMDGKLDAILKALNK